MASLQKKINNANAPISRNFCPNKYDSLYKEIKHLMTENSVRVSPAGKGVGKSLDLLVRETIIGETSFDISATGTLLRSVGVSSLILIFKDLRLFEEKQVFEDGRIRKRNLVSTVTEKIKAGEWPEEAVYRGLSEELGITQRLNLTPVGTTVRQLDSPSYPGLTSRYTIHLFEATLPSGEYKPEGYMEHNPDTGITAYFVWKPSKEFHDLPFSA